MTKKPTAKASAKDKKTYSWLLLIESRHARPPEKEPTGSGERGRPRLNVATTQTSMTLSKGDREAIEFWQTRLSSLLDRKVSMGETVGFLARMCQERLGVLGEMDPPAEDEKTGPAVLQELVHRFVAGSESGTDG